MKLFRFTVFLIVFLIVWWQVRFVLAVLFAAILMLAGAHFPENIEPYRYAHIAVNILDLVISLSLGAFAYRVAPRT